MIMSDARPFAIRCSDSAALVSAKQAFAAADCAFLLAAAAFNAAPTVLLRQERVAANYRLAAAARAVHATAASPVGGRAALRIAARDAAEALRAAQDADTAARKALEAAEDAAFESAHMSAVGDYVE